MIRRLIVGFRARMDDMIPVTSSETSFTRLCPEVSSGGCKIIRYHERRGLSAESDIRDRHMLHPRAQMIAR